MLEALIVGNVIAEDDLTNADVPLLKCVCQSVLRPSRSTGSVDVVA